MWLDLAMAPLDQGVGLVTSSKILTYAHLLLSTPHLPYFRSINPSTGKPYGIDFPDVTIRDTVSMHLEMMKRGIGAKSVRCVIGGSMGGMQALEWVLLGESYIKSCVVIGCGAAHTAWQISIRYTTVVRTSTSTWYFFEDYLQSPSFFCHGTVKHKDRPYTLIQIGIMEISTLAVLQMEDFQWRGSLRWSLIEQRKVKYLN